MIRGRRGAEGLTGAVETDGVGFYEVQSGETWEIR